MKLSRTQFWQSVVIGVSFAGAMLVGMQVGDAAGAPAAPSSVMRACVNKKSGAMRMPSAGSCKSSERSVSWNIKGDKGDKGARGATGTITINGDKCASNQYIGFDGEKWTCVSAPITAFLYSDGSNLSFTKVSQGFKAYSANVAGDTGCNKETCVIRLYDVQDHNSCNAELRGGTFADQSEVLPDTGNILIDFGSGWAQGQALTIAITCLR